jgi:hypothetical protein
LIQVVIIQEALAKSRKTSCLEPAMIPQAPGIQLNAGAFLFGFKGVSIIFACRVKKTGQNF